MAKMLMLAWSTPVSEEAVAAFHQWYDQTHIPQLRAALTTLADVRRYRLRQPDAPELGRFLTIYEFDDADVEGALAAMATARAAGRIDRTETLDQTAYPPAVEWYEAI